MESASPQNDHSAWRARQEDENPPPPKGGSISLVRDCLDHSPELYKSISVNLVAFLSFIASSVVETPLRFYARTRRVVEALAGGALHQALGLMDAQAPSVDPGEAM